MEKNSLGYETTRRTAPELINLWQQQDGAIHWRDHKRGDHLVPMASGTPFAGIVTAGRRILQNRKRILAEGEKIGFFHKVCGSPPADHAISLTAADVVICGESSAKKEFRESPKTALDPFSESGYSPRLKST